MRNLLEVIFKITLTEVIECKNVIRYSSILFYDFVFLSSGHLNNFQQQIFSVFKITKKNVI